MARKIFLKFYYTSSVEISANLNDIADFFDKPVKDLKDYELLYYGREQVTDTDILKNIQELDAEII